MVAAVEREMEGVEGGGIGIDFPFRVVTHWLFVCSCEGSWVNDVMSE